MYYRISEMLHKAQPIDSGVLDEAGRLREQITETIGDEGQAEEYMGSGQEMLDDLLANPDPTKLSAILDSEIDELRNLLPDTDIDFDLLKTEAMKAYEDAVGAGEEPRGAVMKAMLAIKNALARLVGPLISRGGGSSRPETY